MGRIIPARAGFTLFWGLGGLGWGDHPRSRGVYIRDHFAKFGEDGSSPLARGLPLEALRVRFGARIIPARAGFTVDRPGRAGQAPDHPRSRGVYPISPGHQPVVTGSSPLARGLLARNPQYVRRNRIIPARAGFTAIPMWSDSPSPDHPRSRGVYYKVSDLREGERGSSPLARGLPEACAVGVEADRIIPARAGFTG